MKTLFVSCQDIDATQAQELIQALRNKGFAVEHSPRNPMDGEDERWGSWYDDLLPETVQRANAFVIVVDRGWDSATWMAIEADEATGRLRNQPALPMYYYNPQEINVKAAGMLPYLKELLPNDATEAADYLAQKVR